MQTCTVPTNASRDDSGADDPTGNEDCCDLREERDVRVVKAEDPARIVKRRRVVDDFQRRNNQEADS